MGAPMVGAASNLQRENAMNEATNTLNTAIKLANMFITANTLAIGGQRDSWHEVQIHVQRLVRLRRLVKAEESIVAGSGSNAESTARAMRVAIRHADAALTELYRLRADSFALYGPSEDEI
jgi:hypothetical protein